MCSPSSGRRAAAPKRKLEPPVHHTIDVRLELRIDGASRDEDAVHAAIEDVLEALPERAGRHTTVQFARVIAGYVDHDGVAITTA
jgi:hypothetical protein